MPTQLPVLLKIETNTTTFNRRFTSASHFYRQLSNSKMSFSGGGKNGNRDFWSRHIKGGVYYFIPSEDGKLQIIFLLDLNHPEKLEGIKMSLRGRIKRLLKSISVKIKIERLSDEEHLKLEEWLIPFKFYSQKIGEHYKQKFSIAN